MSWLVELSTLCVLVPGICGLHVLVSGICGLHVLVSGVYLVCVDSIANRSMLVLFCVDVFFNLSS